MKLETKPRNTATPFILDVYDAELPAGTARVVARVDARDGRITRTKGSVVVATAKQIREAIAS